MITLEEAAQATGGQFLTRPAGECPPLRGAAFDTRSLGEAELFFALTGEHSDGHTFLPRLAGSHVRLAVVSREAPLGDWNGAVLQVPDTLTAMADMAKFVTAKYQPCVVAITGSYGKTTSKEVIAHVLAGGRRVLKSEGSLNNEIGIPITLLGLDGTQEVAVLEFSARKPGDIAYLGAIAPPDIAVLLAVGHAHIGVFGSREAIYRTKGEIFQALRPGGLALAGAQDPRLRDLAEGHRTQTFGIGCGDYSAEEVRLDGEGRQHFQGVHENTRLGLTAGMPGPHGAEPVLAAWAVARELGLPDTLVAQRAGFHPVQKGRAQIVTTVQGATIVDDCYNASPETVINLAGILAARREPEKILVLGPLAELEEGLETSLALIASHLKPPLTSCLVFDPEGRGLAGTLRRGAQIAIHDLHTQSELIRALNALNAPGRVIGLKGARSAHMERFVAALQGKTVTCERRPCGLLKYCTECENLGAP